MFRDAGLQADDGKAVPDDIVHLASDAQSLLNHAPSRLLLATALRPLRPRPRFPEKAPPRFEGGPRQRGEGYPYAGEERHRPRPSVHGTVDRAQDDGATERRRDPPCQRICRAQDDEQCEKRSQQHWPRRIAGKEVHTGAGDRSGICEPGPPAPQRQRHGCAHEEQVAADPDPVRVTDGAQLSRSAPTKNP